MEKENLYSPEALIDLIIEGDLSISRIAKETNIPLPTLKNYVYGKTEPASMQYRMIKDLTEFFRNGQPLEVILKEHDCVMIESNHKFRVELKHIRDVRVHTFKLLSEFTYRDLVLDNDENAKFEPLLVVLSEELLLFLQSSFSGILLLNKIIKNKDKFNFKFVTSEAILMNENFSYLRFFLFEKANLEMFVKCSDVNAFEKLNVLDKTMKLSKYIFSFIDIRRSVLSEYCYHVILGVDSLRKSHNIADVFLNLEPGMLYQNYDGIVSYDSSGGNALPEIVFNTLTSKFDFMLAVMLSDYENLFDNKNPYYTESQFSGEVKESTFTKFDGLRDLLSNVKVVKVMDLLTDIEHPIRPNHFDIKTFIIDNKVDTTKDLKINVTNTFKDKDRESNYIDRHLIHSIEYTNLTGEAKVYKF